MTLNPNESNTSKVKRILEGLIDKYGFFSVLYILQDLSTNKGHHYGYIPLGHAEKLHEALSIYVLQLAQNLDQSIFKIKGNTNA